MVPHGHWAPRRLPLLPHGPTGGNPIPPNVARIEALRLELEEAFADIRETERLFAAGEGEAARAFLGTSLQTRIDGRINGMIEAALADERSELAEALEEIEVVNRIGVWAAVAATVIGLILTGVVIFMLVLRLRTSLVNLESGAEIFAAGQLDHEIPVSGDDEFAVLAGRFNGMARQLLRQREALEEARATLEQRVAERTEALRAANAELERRDAMRRRFFADIGHELRTPITAVRGEAEVALRAKQDQQEIYHSALDRIVDIADQLTRFVNDIFLIAREQAGVLDLRSDVIDLKQAVCAGVEHMRTMIDQHDVTVTTELGEDPVLIEGDAQRLGQLIRILLSNAIRHAPSGVQILVVLRRVKGGWELSVEDDGPGIPESEIHRVFERYYRGGASAVPADQGGTGLGLPIAKSLVQAHGGRIWIDPDFGSGTAVRAVLPALEDQGPPEACDDPERALQEATT